MYPAVLIFNVQHHVYFQALSWPIASQLQRNEEMEIQVLSFNRFLNNRPLGSATLSLQRLLDESHIQLALSLIDINGRPLKVRKYFSNFSCGFLHPSYVFQLFNL